MNEILRFMDRPRSEFDEVGEYLNGDALQTYLWAHKLSQLADTVMNLTKDQAIMDVQLFYPEGGELFGEKVTIKNSTTYIFNDPKLEKIIGEIDALDKKTKALKASRKATEDMLVADGKAEVAETKTTIAVAKK